MNDTQTPENNLNTSITPSQPKTPESHEIILEQNGSKKTIYLSIKSVLFIVIFTIILLIVLLYINGQGLYDASTVTTG